jgi:hypothetical protein
MPAASGMPAALQKTRLATGLASMPAPGPASAAGARTVIAEPPAMRRASSAMSAIAPPQELQMNTMRIATPAGYSSRPPRRVWPVVLTMAMLLGVGGGVLSVTCFGHDGGARASEPQVRSPAGSNGSEPAGSAALAGAAIPVATPPILPGSSAAGGAGAGRASGGAPGPGVPGAGNAPAGASGTASGPTSGSVAGSTTATSPGGAASTPGTGRAGSAGASTRPALRTAHLTIESVPVGAHVKGPGGEELGRTPLITDWPTSDIPVKFELRLGGYRPKHKQTVINGNTRLVIELERVPVVRRGGSRPGSGAKSPGSSAAKSPGSGSARTSNSNRNGLMRPDE